MIANPDAQNWPDEADVEVVGLGAGSSAANGGVYYAGGGAVLDANGEYLDQWVLRPEGRCIVRQDAHWHTHGGEAAIISSDP